MKTIKIAGVPEHFNLPWHLCIEDGEFNAVGIDLQWTDVPEGTGKMCQMLRTGETDIAVLLTEGIIKDITEGNSAKIVQIYVQSPLIWGIHVAMKAPYQNLSDLENKKVAISRMGSGSHLMSLVNATNQHWNTKDLQFEIVNTIDGAVDSLTNGNADYFMWERFMTQPLVDQKIFRRIAECPTPWPCFVIAVRNELLESDPKIIQQILDIINTTTQEFKEIPSIDRTLAMKYKLELAAVQEWLTGTRWSQKQMTKETLDKIQSALFEMQLITTTLPLEDFLSK
ncbi:substrate-binding domain-containing protein [Flavobacterium sp.]|jgi:ABC-type nitrate/sulfonate/bicarbonate transport system substrate-binding protein|uniref:substrate-binding domain-containing protein n=1 Tax=Flavobacterium sp. TaxID=239 RepID=UPI0037BF53A9